MNDGILRIAIFEDDEERREGYAIWLREIRCQIQYAANYYQGETLAERIRISDVPYHIVIMDGNLGHARNDGEILTGILRQSNEPPFVISVSSNLQKYGDANLIKGQPETKDLVLQAIREQVQLIEAPEGRLNNS